MPTQLNSGWTPQEILDVAKRQSQIIYMIVINLVAAFIPFATIVAGLVQMFFIFKLAQAVRSSVAWLYIVLAFIPLLGLVGLLILNQSATRILQTQGIKVGLMGARSSDLERFRKSA